MGMGWHYRRSYETVLVGQKPGAACKWYDKTKKIENIIRPNAYGIRKIIPSKDDHPTPKPVELAEHFIKLHTVADDVVIDPFAGYGWVGVAAIKTGRKFIGIEISEEYFAIAKRRIEQAIEQHDGGPMFKDCKPVQLWDATTDTKLSTDGKHD